MNHRAAGALAPAALYCRLRGTDRATHTRESRGNVKAEIHPEYVVSHVTCTCGNTFTTHSTAANGVIHADVCSACHPFYTGKQKILDTGGRVARFEARYAKKAPAEKAAAATAPAEASESK